MTRETDILHQAGGFYVHRDKGSTVTVYRPSASGTHATPDCTFSGDADGLSLAKARCDYLAKRAVK